MFGRQPIPDQPRAVGSTPDGPEPAPARGSRSRWWRAVDWVLAVTGLGVAVWQVAPVMAGVGDVASRLAQLRWGWLSVALMLSAASLAVYGELHRLLLAYGGSRLPGRTVQAVTIAGNAVSLTVPAAGAAAGSAYAVSALHIRGVSLALSAWAVGMAGIVATIVLVVLAPLGLAGDGLLSLPVGGGVSALLLVLVIGAYVLLRKQRVLAWAGRRAVWVARRLPVLRRMTAATPAQAATGFSEWVTGRVLDPGQGTLVMAAAVATWVLDFLALAGCVAAAAAPVPWPAVAVGYLVVQASILVRLTPGGAGPAETGLLAVLIGGGVPAGSAAIAVVLYRAISWVGPAVVGWCVFLALGEHQVAAGHRRSADGQC